MQLILRARLVPEVSAEAYYGPSFFDRWMWSALILYELLKLSKTVFLLEFFYDFLFLAI